MFFMKYHFHTLKSLSNLYQRFLSRSVSKSSIIKVPYFNSLKRDTSCEIKPNIVSLSAFSCSELNQQA